MLDDQTTPTKKAPDGAALGIDAKSTNAPHETPAYQGLRALRFDLQKTAARLLPKERIGNCLWTIARNSHGVSILRREGPDGNGYRARYTGLQTCGSVWHCPVCSHRISETRRRELNTALEHARADGLMVRMMTLTFSHQQGEPLADLIKAAKAAKTHFTNSRAWKSLKKRRLLVGTITATELTHGANGWHPHFHILVFLRPNDLLTLDDIGGDTLRKQWLASLDACGRSGGHSAFDLQDGTAAGSYVAKWGAAEELTLGSKKGGKGRNPFRILEDASTGDAQSSELFREYARAFKGVRQLFWTNGLKALLSVGETTDEDAADLPQENAEAIVTTIQGLRWKDRARGKRARLLDVAENVSDLLDAAHAVECEIRDEDDPRRHRHQSITIPTKGA